MALEIIGLAHECLDITNEIWLQNDSLGTHKKGLIKRTIVKKIKEESWNRMENSIKSQRQAHVQTRRQHIYQMPVLTTYNSYTNSFSKIFKRMCNI